MSVRYLFGIALMLPLTIASHAQLPPDGSGGGSAHYCVAKDIRSTNGNHFRFDLKNSCSRAIDVYICAHSRFGWACGQRGIKGTDGSGESNGDLSETILCDSYQSCNEWNPLVWNAVYQGSGEKLTKPDVDNSTQHRAQ